MILGLGLNIAGWAKLTMTDPPCTHKSLVDRSTLSSPLNPPILGDFEQNWIGSPPELGDLGG